MTDILTALNARPAAAVAPAPPITGLSLGDFWNAVDALDAPPRCPTAADAPPPRPAPRRQRPAAVVLRARFTVDGCKIAWPECAATLGVGIARAQRLVQDALYQARRVAEHYETAAEYSPLCEFGCFDG